jgi:hypothetical protein
VLIENIEVGISAMIEFKGIYYNDNKKKPVAALIQFDGQLLHVWHLTDPFFRLRSSPRFAVKRTNKKEGKMIKFPDGACIETDNNHALETLMEKINASHASKCRVPCKKGAIVFIALLILLLIGAGWSILP